MSGDTKRRSETAPTDNTYPVFKRDDIVVEDGLFSTFYLVLTCGPVAYDLIEQSGGTTRYRHDHGRHIRVATLADFCGDVKYQTTIRERLEKEASNARRERRAGARVYRGHVSPRR